VLFLLRLKNGLRILYHKELFLKFLILTIVKSGLILKRKNKGEGGMLNTKVIQGNKPKFYAPNKTRS
jgi:hypothetical protein